MGRPQPAPTLRALLFACTLATCAARLTAQGVTITGQVFLREAGQPLAYTVVAVPSRGTQFITGAEGTFALRDLPPGATLIRFRRIGFVPLDTTLTVSSNAATHLRVEMTRLALRLPTVVVRGRCTDRSPLERASETLEQLFDQVKQNAERVRLAAEARPFEIEVLRVRGRRDRSGLLIPEKMESVARSPLPERRYAPRQVIRRGAGAESGEWHVMVPELSDFADSAFTNNHCFRYAGQQRFFADSVIRVDYLPVPWLAKQADIEGSMFLAVGTYQLVGTITRLNRIPAQFRRTGLRDFTVTARFAELVPGVPVLFSWELVNGFRPPNPAFVETGEVTGIKWRDSTEARPH